MISMRSCFARTQCWSEKSVTESHFIQSYHCSSNRLEVAEKL